LAESLSNLSGVDDDLILVDLRVALQPRVHRVDGDLHRGCRAASERRTGRA